MNRARVRTSVSFMSSLGWKSKLNSVSQRRDSLRTGPATRTSASRNILKA